MAALYFYLRLVHFSFRLSLTRAAGLSFFVRKKDVKTFFFLSLTYSIYLSFGSSLRPRPAHPFWRSPKRMQKGWSRGRTAPLHLAVRRTKHGKGRRHSGRGERGAGSRACPLNDPRSRREARPIEKGWLQKKGITKISPSLAENPLKASPLGYGRGLLRGASSDQTEHLLRPLHCRPLPRYVRRQVN